MDWSPKSTATSWAGLAIAQPIISQAFFFFFSIYNSTVEPLHNGHLGDRQKVTVLERFKQKPVYGLSTTKSGRCRKVAVTGGSTVLLIFVLKADTTYLIFFERKYILIIVQLDLRFSLFVYKTFADDPSGFGTFVL